MSDKRRKLDDYFNEARRQEPVISKDSAQRLIDGFDGSGAVSPSIVQKTKFFQGVNKMNIITSAITVAAAVATLLISDLGGGSTAISVSEHAVEFPTAKYQANQEFPEPALKPVAPEIEADLAQIAQANIPVIEKRQTQIIDETTIKGVKLLRLTNEEAEKLGLDITPECELKFAKKMGNKPMICRLSSMAGSIVNKFESAENEVDCENIISPRMVTDMKGNKRMMWFNDSITNVFRFSTECDETIAIPEFSNMFGDSLDLSNLSKTFVKLKIDSGRSQLINDIYSTKIPSLKKRIVMSASCDSVESILESLESTSSEDIIRRIVKNADDGDENFKQADIRFETVHVAERIDDADKKAKKYNIRIFNNSSSFDKIKTLTFNDEFFLKDLEKEFKIIQINPDSLLINKRAMIVTNSIGGDFKTDSLIMKFEFNNIDSGKIDLQNFGEQLGKNMKFKWQAKLREISGKLSSVEKDIDKYIKINKLIPVYVPMNCSDEPDFAFIVWYEATPEFMEALPQNVKYELQREILALQEAEQICEAAPKAGENTYLDLWRSCSGGVENLAVFPNPAADRVNISFNLLDSRTVSIALHDLHGRKIQDLMPKSPMKKGETSLSILLRNVPAGIYLISLETDKGETAVQRVVVE